MVRSCAIAFSTPFHFEDVQPLCFASSVQVVNWKRAACGDVSALCTVYQVNQVVWGARIEKRTGEAPKWCGALGLAQRTNVTVWRTYEMVWRQGVRRCT